MEIITTNIYTDHTKEEILSDPALMAMFFGNAAQEATNYFTHAFNPSSFSADALELENPGQHTSVDFRGTLQELAGIPDASPGNPNYEYNTPDEWMRAAESRPWWR